MSFAIRGTLVQCAPAAPVEHAVVIEVMHDTLVLIEDGIITQRMQGSDADELEALLQSEQRVRVIHLADTDLLLPGFIDLHVHPCQASFSGSGTDLPDIGVDGWLNKCAYPAEQAWADPEVAAVESDAVVRRTLSHGTTAAVYFGTIHVEGTLKLVDACIAHGLRAVVGKVNMDRNAPADYSDASTADSLRDTEAFIEGLLARTASDPSSSHPCGPLVLPALTPRFVPHCTPELMAGLGALRKKYERHRIFVQSHIAQSRGVVAFVEKLHGAELEPGESALFDRHGLLTDRCIMAHAIHLTDGDVALVAQRKASLAFCPNSNMFHTEVPCSTLDAPRALRCGCRIGLSTDVGGGYHHSMLNACRTSVVASRCLFASTPVDWKYALWLATRGGAAALGMNLGGFEVGNEFDAQLVDVSRGDVLLRTPGQLEAAKAALRTCKADRAGSMAAIDGTARVRAVEVLVEKYVNLGDDRNVKAVWVRGRCVHEKAPVSSSDGNASGCSVL